MIGRNLTKLAALAGGLLFITSTAFPTTRVGNGGRTIENAEVGFSFDKPQTVLSYQTTGDGELALIYANRSLGYSAPLGRLGMSAVQPFVIVAPAVKAYPQFASLGEKAIQDWFRNSDAKWAEIATGTCARAYKSEKPGSFTGLVLFGKGRGVFVTGALTIDTAAMVEEIVRTLEIHGSCTW